MTLLLNYLLAVRATAKLCGPNTLLKFPVCSHQARQPSAESNRALISTPNFQSFVANNIMELDTDDDILRTLAEGKSMD